MGIETTSKWIVALLVSVSGLALVSLALWTWAPEMGLWLVVATTLQC